MFIYMYIYRDSDREGEINKEGDIHTNIYMYCEYTYIYIDR